MVKRRKPVAALLLSLLPGLGQIYNGQLTKGLAFVLFDLLFPVIFGLTGLALNLSGLMIMLVVATTFVVYRMADGYIVAKRLKDYELKAINKWYVYLFYTLSLVGIRLFLDAPTSTGIQTFKIPTPSMVPTLLQGDRVVAQLNAYNKTLIDYGDIVVFNSPEGGIWTFRVVGLPLDSIEIIDGKVSVNGQLNEVKEGARYLSDGQEVIEFEEQLQNNKRIKTVRFKSNSFPDARTMAKKLIPENEYFLMGDNRDNAFDSRFIGTIKKEDILGRVIYSYWGNTSDRINIDFRLQ